MKRREFVQLGILGGAVGLVLSRPAAGSGASALDSKMAGGVFHTKEAPGRWAKKTAGHVPKVEKKAASDGKVRIDVVTSHGMSAWKHYIVKHMLLDKDFKFIAEKMFDPTKDKTPRSSFTIDAYKGPLYVLSVCNKHDTWISVVSL
jgi:superoxide reductase